MSKRYNDGVLDEKFANLSRQIEDKDRADADRFEASTKVWGDIKEQTTKTNGSVRNLQLWRSYILGGLTILTIIIVPALGFLAVQILGNTQHIAAIDAVITQLELH